MAKKLCEYCGEDHKNAPSTRVWHKAYQFIKVKTPKIPFNPNGTRDEFYPDWALKLDAKSVHVQLWPNLNQAIVERDKFTCQDCGKIFEHDQYNQIKYRWLEAEVHHIVPRGLGGSDHPANLKFICKACHQKYNDKFNPIIKRRNHGLKLAKPLNNFESAT